MVNPRYARDVDMTAIPAVVKEFFDGYQIKPVSFKMAASLRDHKTCLYAKADEFDDFFLKKQMLYLS